MKQTMEQTKEVLASLSDTGGMQVSDSIARRCVFDFLRNGENIVALTSRGFEIEVTLIKRVSVHGVLI